MCGIAGWFATVPNAADAGPRLASMLAAIAHRGPDGSAQALFSHAALGHVRLAIIDLDGGAQPMRALDRDLTISFNGEIYNYRALRAELIGRGYRFHTQSDTEVILNLYLAWGIAGLHRLRGMYAFALWDADRQEGVLARDPLGIKPCFVHTTPGGNLLFASEAKALLAADPGRRELDPAALHLLMNFRYLPGDLTLFRRIRQLPPGQVLIWSRAGVRQSIIGLPPPGDPQAPVLDALRESVRLHLTADVEVGAYLSGGVDSAAITALCRETGAVSRTFTLAVGDNPREAEYAARSAELLGVENLREAQFADVGAVLPRLIWHLETPKVNALQVYQLAAFAARHLKVVLSGLGGDELFLGYNAHRIVHQAERLNRVLPGWMTHPAGRAAAAVIARLSPLPWSEPERAALMLAQLGHWDRVYGLIRNLWDSPALRRQVYGPRMLDEDLPDAVAVLADGWQPRGTAVEDMAAYEWRQKMVNDLLWQEDRVSMAQGLEVRVPFVDAVFAQRVQGLGEAHLMPGGRPKAFMRDMLADLLPAEVLTRPKSGFQVDAPAFVEQHLGGLLDDWLAGPPQDPTALFNPQFARLVRGGRPGSNPRWHYFMLYLMLGTRVWESVFIGQRSAPPPLPR